MQNKLNTLIILSICIFIASCGVANRLSRTSTVSSTAPKSSVPAPSKATIDTPKIAANLPPAIHASAYSQIQTSLRKVYRQWNSTPYQWGGTTIHGVDCSAFMQIIFNRYFGIEIPRTTEQQVEVGDKVSRKHLKPGDLIFFKTGRQTLHVGIIIEMPKFIHASSSEGVTISSLEKYYWRSRFLTAKRVL